MLEAKTGITLKKKAPQWNGSSEKQIMKACIQGEGEEQVIQ